jgi:hypothetical protein
MSVFKALLAGVSVFFWLICLVLFYCVLMGFVPFWWSFFVSVALFLLFPVTGDLRLVTCPVGLAF